jgi:Haem-binding domain
MKGKARGFAITVLVLFVAIQFVPVEVSKDDAGKEVPAPEAVRTVLRRHCYDCHSNQTRWPWYSKVAPVSWLVNYDVKEGRSRLNFTDWDEESGASTRFKIAHSGHRLRRAGPDVGDSLMPPASYLWLHPDAGLTVEERKTLLEWAGTHGIPFDSSSVRLRVWKPPFPETQSLLPCAVMSAEVKMDDASELKGTVRKGLPKPVELGEFDPQDCGAEPDHQKLVGLNRVQGTCRGDFVFSEGFLYVDGEVDLKTKGFGALVSTGPVSLKLSDPARLFVLSEGDVTIEGFDSTCQLAVVCGGSLTLRNIQVEGSVLASELVMENASLEYDSELTRGRIPLGSARREILAYCDRDGELAEDDRLMAVLFDNGVYRLSDPEYDASFVARGPNEAVQMALKLMTLDPAMNPEKWKKLGYAERWAEAFRRLPGDQTRQAVLEYDLQEWVEPESPALQEREGINGR